MKRSQTDGKERNMTRKELLEYFDAMTHLAKNLMKRKNHDYAGDDKPFANFEVGKALGIGETAQGILFRMSDKFKRMIGFVQSGEFKVKTESFEDTCLDLINYTVLLAAYLKEQNDD